MTQSSKEILEASCSTRSVSRKTLPSGDCLLTIAHIDLRGRVEVALSAVLSAADFAHLCEGDFAGAQTEPPCALERPAAYTAPSNTHTEIYRPFLLWASFRWSNLQLPLFLLHALQAAQPLFFAGTGDVILCPASGRDRETLAAHKQVLERSLWDFFSRRSGLVLAEAWPKEG